MFEDVTSRYDLSDATIEIIIMLLVAFLLGLLLGYLLSKRCCSEDTNQNSDRDNSLNLVGTSHTTAPTQANTSDNNEDIATQSDKNTMSDNWKPATLSSPNGKADDLKRISGVGPVLEKVLNDTGIYHYQQIAELSSDNISWLDDRIAFPGRIERENWVGQAKDLMAGVKTDFANRYDKNQTS